MLNMILKILKAGMINISNNYFIFLMFLYASFLQKIVIYYKNILICRKLVGVFLRNSFKMCAYLSFLHFFDRSKTFSLLIPATLIFNSIFPNTYLTKKLWANVKIFPTLITFVLQLWVSFGILHVVTLSRSQSNNLTSNLKMFFIIHTTTI